MFGGIVQSVGRIVKLRPFKVDAGALNISVWEKLVAEKNVATREMLARYRDAWACACERTPHGRPIQLEPRDFR